MKRYISIILAVAAVLLFNLIVIAEKNIVINSVQTSSIIEITRCLRDTTESLQYLIDSDDAEYQNRMMSVISGKFSTLYHLCHANHYIYSEACSDFRYIGATFIGPASIDSFTMTGIYDDGKITENEYEYIDRIIDLLNKALENISGHDAESDLEVLNNNLEYIHGQLYDTDASPFCLIDSRD